MDEHSMLELSPVADHRLDRALLEQPGGFVWWYLDMVDESGDGLVLIWSFGLPFLPGYASAARRGAAPRPCERPSLNLSIYRGGELDFYLLQEFEAGDAIWEEGGDVWRFGGSELRAGLEDGVRTLEADLDCEVPGSDGRLRGSVRVEGPACSPSRGEPLTLPVHDWTPLMGPGRGEADLSVDTPDGPGESERGEAEYSLRGRAYHDRNGGRKPQHELGMEHWLWGRVPLPDEERIFYLMWPHNGGAPQALGLEIDRAGTIHRRRDLTLELGAPRFGRAGMPYWKSLHLRSEGRPWLDVRYTDVLDDGPFYLRFLIEAEAAKGATARGLAEACRPDRVDRDLMRPLVRMRVHRVDGKNSMWLPLFTGPKRGRLRRLVHHVFDGARGGRSTR
jgi:hypothetical protein